MFCPSYRREIFDNPQVESRFKKLVEEICVENEWNIIEMECGKDHVHLNQDIMDSKSVFNKASKTGFESIPTF